MSNDYISLDLLDAIERDARILRAKIQYAATLQRLADIAAKTGDASQLDHLRDELRVEGHTINLTKADLTGHFRQALGITTE